MKPLAALVEARTLSTWLAGSSDRSDRRETAVREGWGGVSRTESVWFGGMHGNLPSGKITRKAAYTERLLESLRSTVSPRSRTALLLKYRGQAHS